MASAVIIEPATDHRLARRAFRRMDCGALEYAFLADWQANGERARFYGFASSELPSSFNTTTTEEN